MPWPGIPILAQRGSRLKAEADELFYQQEVFTKEDLIQQGVQGLFIDSENKEPIRQPSFIIQNGLIVGELNEHGLATHFQTPWNAFAAANSKIVFVDLNGESKCYQIQEGRFVALGHSTNIPDEGVFSVYGESLTDRDSGKPEQIGMIYNQIAVPSYALFLRESLREVVNETKEEKNQRKAGLARLERLSYLYNNLRAQKLAPFKLATETSQQLLSHLKDLTQILNVWWVDKNFNEVTHLLNFFIEILDAAKSFIPENKKDTSEAFEALDNFKKAEIEIQNRFSQLEALRTVLPDSTWVKNVAIIHQNLKAAQDFRWSTHTLPDLRQTSLPVDNETANQPTSINDHFYTPLQIAKSFLKDLVDEFNDAEAKAHQERGEELKNIFKIVISPHFEELFRIISDLETKLAAKLEEIGIDSVEDLKWYDEFQKYEVLYNEQVPLDSISFDKLKNDLNDLKAFFEEVNETKNKSNFTDRLDSLKTSLASFCLNKIKEFFETNKDSMSAENILAETEAFNRFIKTHGADWQIERLTDLTKEVVNANKPSPSSMPKAQNGLPLTIPRLETLRRFVTIEARLDDGFSPSHIIIWNNEIFEIDSTQKTLNPILKTLEQIWIGLYGKDSLPNDWKIYARATPEGFHNDDLFYKFIQEIARRLKPVPVLTKLINLFSGQKSIPVVSPFKKQTATYNRKLTLMLYARLAADILGLNLKIIIDPKTKQPLLVNLAGGQEEGYKVILDGSDNALSFPRKPTFLTSKEINHRPSKEKFYMGDMPPPMIVE